ncbi:RND family efflux transporter, MFP subunit [Mizugakiibacter sediminis]|uniref:RND family efflux transporter, MFP subunit n=1 Tax=Mizugakiibacter sediminis TaxID=1475481 RepID=A0A0K8QR27_9GAMM|nr:RND family efflux transporter, MFP subunit [Mizugakiibacter sediminis]
MCSGSAPPVARLLVAQGDPVERGQPLATVTSPDFAAAPGAYRKAAVTATNARRIADNDADMQAHHAISQREAEQAQTDAVAAEADRAAALQALVALDIDPRALSTLRAGKDAPRVDGVIRAPIAGTVVEKNISPGQLLQAGSTPCFTIADLSRVWVNANVFGDDVGSVHTSDPASNSLGEGAKPLPGKVTLGIAPRLGEFGYMDQNDAVEGVILLRTGEKTLDVLRAIEAKTRELNQDILPRDVKIHPFYDLSHLIDETTR